MSIKNKIESLTKEAEIYQNQGLLDQSKETYLKIIEIINQTEELSKDERLIDSIHDRIRTVEEELHQIDEASESPELTEEVQNLISNLFSFSKNKDMAAIEGAVALAKFGQYEKALAEFQKLLNQGILPIMVAKNMLRCHLNLGSPNAAISQFKRWVSHKSFSKAELGYLRNFIQNILESTAH